jgi:hypothetical protein
VRSNASAKEAKDLQELGCTLASSSDCSKALLLARTFSRGANVKNQEIEIRIAVPAVILPH